MDRSRRSWTPNPDLVMLLTQLTCTGLCSWLLTASSVRLNSSSENHWLFFLLSLLTLWASLLGLSWIMNSLIRLGQWSAYLLPHFMLCLACLLLSLVQQSMAMAWPASTSYVLLSLGLGLLTFGFHQTLGKLLQVRRPEHLCLTVMLGIMLLTALVWEYRQVRLQGLQEPSLRLARWTYLILAAYPLWVLVLHSLSAQQRGERTRSTWPIQLKKLLKKKKDRVLLIAAHWLTVGLNLVIIQFVLLSLLPTTQGWGLTGPSTLWASLSLQAIPSCFWAWWTWRRINRVPRHIRGPILLRPNRVPALLRAQPTEHHAHWVGLRTALVMLDHDPHEDCRSHLPAFLYKIRQTQCEQLMKQAFPNQIFSLESSGAQLMLALDPEQTQACCTDALLLLTVFYLDALPLVDKRLKQLVRLLPLLDPGSEQHLSEQDIDSVLGRLQSFFHLDYNWMDHSIQTTDTLTSIDVKLESLNPRARYRFLDQIKGAQWLGNYIWISDSARHRLRTESPYIASAIERCPIRLEQEAGEAKETAAFLIKFEHLVPRLQRYFMLDDIRSRLAPLPLDEQTRRLVETLGEKLSKIADPQILQEVLHKLKSHEWNGFRAKDLALDLLVKLVNEAERLLAAPDLVALRQQARELIFDIGYPSQDLHDAHLRKLELRNLDELRTICLDPVHPQCLEAWLLLASLPQKRLDADVVSRVLQLISTACTQSHLRHSDTILRKACEAFFQFAPLCPPERQPEVQSGLELLAQTLLETKASLHLLLGFMDRKLALDQQRGEPLPLSPRIMKGFNRTIASVLDNPSVHPALRASLQMRWTSLAQGEFRREAS